MNADIDENSANPNKNPNSFLPTKRTDSEEPLRQCVRDAVDNYFAHLEGHSCHGLYQLVMSEVELPLLEVVMRHAGGNQTVAAEMLGINRGTLRRKLKEYALI